MNSLDKLALYNILLQSEPEDVKTLSEINKKFSKLCSNDVIFKNLLEAHFPKTVKRKNTYREQYFHMIDILTEDNFNSMKSRPDIASELGLPTDPILDIYDLLYLTGGDHDWGVINFPLFIEKIPLVCEEFFLLRFFVLNELYTGYREGEIGRVRTFLNNIGGFGSFDEIVWNDINIETVKSSYIICKNKEDYIKSLFTLEERLQKETKSLPCDVREQIKKYQSNIGDESTKDSLYNDREIEFLQILHDAVQNDVIGIFEPFDFQILINKLKRKY